MTARPEPLSRRERPAKPALTRSGIVSTAVRIMRAEGLQRVTMRRLAKELDTGPASLYVYVANTAELHAAILDELLGEVDLAPATEGGDWREQIEAVLASYSHLLGQHPSLAHSALVARPSGPNYLNLLNALLALLSQGGVPDDQAAWGVDTLLQVATASAAEHAVQDDSPSTEKEWEAVAAAVENASATEVPHVAALGSELLSGTPQMRRTWATQMLLNGILHTPRPTS
ncbi:TetR/AcrR family transcriptional regulator [Streptomyces sp. NBC_00878]|uniref:TetR/AcrR family transcriptional regulator n=1 Tax=Streptomyces sp. NBC_00878 TaxID=2975854 RepID=UPI002254B9CE|nr:TetR/AcrR family transcriptional regulator [Streptomyces sp. NBC_00878]MCX4905419.1 TetR/AcrR family transcriptional regulator [Streptomyces sp. NBC_00878]